MLNLADLEARVARLESRNYVSMRYGRVRGTKDGEAQIQLNDAKNNVSMCRSALMSAPIHAPVPGRGRATKR